MDLDTLLQGHRDAITVRRIYGDPVERDGVTIVPAAVVMGGTGGGDEGGNGGVGLGLAGRPAGAWVISDGEVTWKPAIDVTRLAAIAAVAYVAVRLLTRR